MTNEQIRMIIAFIVGWTVFGPILGIAFYLVLDQPTKLKKFLSGTIILTVLLTTCALFSITLKAIFP